MAARRAAVTGALAPALTPSWCVRPWVVAARSRTRRLPWARPEKEDRAARTLPSDRSCGKRSWCQARAWAVMASPACRLRLVPQDGVWRPARAPAPAWFRQFAPGALRALGCAFVVFVVLAWLFPPFL